ncbi:hypothetical protein A3A59_00455, partial [Candidatus Gottesmanbacteria bacterium RIFCSPLOWO2_01_FULL_42_10]
MSNDVTPIRSTTQEFLEIEDIKNDLVLLANGSCATIIETTAVNFGLLSEKEQEALIFAYSGLLNSLSFPIQIYLRSKRKDISGYLTRLAEAEKTQTNPLLAKRISLYRTFIAATVKERNVLDKKFYIVIPFSALELGVTNVNALIKRKGLPYPKDYILNRAQTVLTPKRDHLLRQLNRLGLKGTQLTTQ